MEKFRAFIEQITPISDSTWEYFVPHIVKREYKKKSEILAAGQTEQYLSFIEEGIIRFHIPKVERDLTIAFIFPNELFCAYDSFLTQKAAVYSAQALSHTVLWSFSYQALQMLYKEVPVTNTIGRILSEEIYLKKAMSDLLLLNRNAKERYKRVFEERPGIMQKIPLKYIASYIGITPQALSRIRKQIN